MLSSLWSPNYIEYDFRPALFILFVVIGSIAIVVKRNWQAVSNKGEWENEEVYSELTDSYRYAVLLCSKALGKRQRRRVR